MGREQEKELAYSACQQSDATSIMGKIVQNQEGLGNSCYCPCLLFSTQVLLPGAQPSPGGAGTTGWGNLVRHLPGACRRQALLPHHGVPQLPRGMVPPGLHPGMRPFQCSLGMAGA